MQPMHYNIKVSGHYQASLYANIEPDLINTLKELKIIIATTIQ